MISRKIVIIFLSVYFILATSLLAAAALLTPLISRLAPAAATATGVGGGFTIPAKVVAKTSSGLNVAKWVALAVPGSTGAKVAVAVLSVSGAVAADYLMAKGAAWFAGQNLTRDENGDFVKTDNVTVPNGYNPEDYDSELPIQTSLQAAANAATAKCVTIPGVQVVEGLGYGPTSKGCGSFVCHMYYYGPPEYRKEYLYYYFLDNNDTHDVPFPNPKTLDDVGALLGNDLANENAAAKDVAKAALEVAADAMDNPDHPVAKNKTASDKINSDLAANLTEGQKTNLEGEGTADVGDDVLPDTTGSDLTPAQIAAAMRAALESQGLSANQIAAAVAAASNASSQGLTQAEAQAAVAAALAGQGLSAAQIQNATSAALTAAGLATNAGVKTAVKEAIDDESGVAVPTDVVPIIPDKLSLTTVMQDFMTSVNALPMFATLRGLTINVSGSASLCLSMPTNLGGTKCFDASGMQDSLNMIGSALLGLTTIFSFIGIFKG